jgi:glycerate kinase
VRVLAALDRFTGHLTSAEAAAAVAAGWGRTAPTDPVEQLALGDGGSGFLDVLQRALGGRLLPVSVSGPRGEPVPAAVLLHEGTAYVDTAHAVGPDLVVGGAPAAPGAAPARWVDDGTSYGVGELLLAAAASGARRVVVGVGSAVVADGGAGALAALGAQPEAALRRGPGPLPDLADVRLDAARARVEGLELVVATDVDTPLLGPDGAAGRLGAAGALDRAARDRLEVAMRSWATRTDGAVAVRPGAGAGGGLGFGLLLLGSRRVPGAALVAEALGLDARVRVVDLVLTGEAVFDWESLRGKVVTAAARAGQAAGRPVVVLADRVDVGRRELSAAGVDAAYAASDLPAGEVGHTTADRLAALAARVARTWSR